VLRDRRAKTVASRGGGRRLTVAAALLGVLTIGAGGLVGSGALPAFGANCHSTKTCPPPTTTTTLAITTTKAPTTTAAATTTTTTVPPTTTTAAATTTTVPPTTTTITAPPGTCVAVTPTSNIQALIDAYGPGTSFCFAAGTYVLTTFLIPRANDKFISNVARGAILTGSDVYDAGIRQPPWPAAAVSGVTVQGFVITHMKNSWGSVPRSALTTFTGWTVQNNEISYNAQAGLELEGSNQVLDNFVHHNGRYGIEGYKADSTLIQNNEIANNNTAHYDPGDDASATKIANSANVTFNNNNVHDNYGQGLWSDGDNINTMYSNNTVRNNAGIGIFHEISYDAVIRNNTLSNNATLMTGKSLWWGAEIFLNTSQNVQIYSNTVTAAVHGIGLAAYDRGTGKYGTYKMSNVSVHDNIVTLPVGGQVGLNSSATTYNAYALGNTWVHNTYHVPDLTAALFQWSGGGKTWAQWQALGNDTTGTFSH
jgi:parallel beta-helix repeat protein